MTTAKTRTSITSIFNNAAISNASSPVVQHGSPGHTIVPGSSSSALNSTERMVGNILAETDELMEKIKGAEQLRKSEVPSILKIHTVRIRAWRQKRLDTTITATYENLFPRMMKAVESTSILVDEVEEKTVALRDQARALKVRLSACVAYNADYLANRGGIVDEMRNVVDSLSAYSSDVKAMITFNVEVIRQKLVQSVSQGRSFVSWGNRAMLLRPISETELGEDADHSFLMQKLRYIRESREQLMGRLTDMLELREQHQINFDSCSLAYAELCDLIAAVDEAVASTNPPVEIPPYDHTQCQDCSVINTMAMQCVDHLSNLLKQQEDARHWSDVLLTAKTRLDDAKTDINNFYELQQGAAAQSNQRSDSVGSLTEISISSDNTSLGPADAKPKGISFDAAADATES